MLLENLERVVCKGVTCGEIEEGSKAPRENVFQSGPLPVYIILDASHNLDT